MKTFHAIVTAALLGVVATAASAQSYCYYNGKQVADGTRIGERECRNGAWVDL